MRNCFYDRDMSESPDDHPSLPAASPSPTREELEHRLWPIRRAVTLTLIGGCLLIGVLTLVGLVLLGLPGIEQEHKVPISTFFDVLKLSFGAVAGIGAAVALVMTYRRQRVAEAANRLAVAASRRDDQAAELDQAKETRERTRLFNERFATASGQLGHDQPAVRLAGIYAMAGLADDWPAHRQTCIDVLCAYLRMPYPELDDSFLHDERVAWHREREVRHTVVRVITAHLRDDATTSWCGHDFDFGGTNFDGGDFSRARFSGGTARFASAKFSGWADFHRTDFSGGYVNFASTEFCGHGISFDQAKFCGGQVNFSRARFPDGEVRFPGAEFSSGEVDFGGAEFCGGTVTFHWAKYLSGGTVRFVGADFSGGIVDLSGGGFSGAKVDFSAAKFSGGKVRLEPLQDWSVPAIGLPHHASGLVCPPTSHGPRALPDIPI